MEISDRDLEQAAGGKNYTLMSETELSKEGYRMHPPCDGENCPKFVGKLQRVTGKQVCYECENVLISVRMGKIYCKLR